MANGVPGVFKPALIAGAVFGFLGGNPYSWVANCACCVLVVGAGFTATLLYSNSCRSLGLAVSVGDGAKLGFLSGLVYGVVETITWTVSTLLFHASGMQWVIAILEDIPQVPSQFLDHLGREADTVLAASILLDLVGSLGYGIIFATLGGLIGGAVFKSEPAATAPPAVPPAQG